MTRSMALLAGLGLGLAGLAACDGTDAAFGNGQIQFGPAFAAAFVARPEDDPQEDLLIVFRGVSGPSLVDGPIDIADRP